MKVLKTIFLILIITVVLTVGLILAAVTLIDPNQHKERISGVVEQKIGRTLQIDGQLDWGLWPRLHLSGGGISMGNARGFGSEPFFTLESFSFSLATLPLISSELRLDTIELSGLHLNLARDQQGRNNWDDLLPPPQQKPQRQTTAPAEGRGLPFSTLMLGGVKAQNLNVIWRDQTNGRVDELRDLQLHLGAMKLGDPMDLSLAFTVLSNQPEIEARSELEAKLVYNLKAETYAVSPLKLTTTFSGPTVPGKSAKVDMAAKMSFNKREQQAEIKEFTLNGMGMEMAAEMDLHGLNQPIPGAVGELKVEIGDLVRLLKIFELPSARQLAGVKERSIRLHSRFNLAPEKGTISISNLEAGVLGTVLSGRLEGKNINSAQPEVKGGIKAEGPDLPALLGLAAKLRPGADERALSRAFTGLDQRGVTAEALFSSEGPDIVIPHLFFKGLSSEVKISGRLSNLGGKGPVWQGELEVGGSDLPLLLRVAGAFQGEVDANGGGTEAVGQDGVDKSAPGEELCKLAARLAAARKSSFSLNTELYADTAKGELRLENFQARGLGLELQTELMARELFTAPAFQLQLGLSPFNPRELMALLAIPLPETSDSKALSQMAFTGRVSGTTSQVRVAPLKVTLDSSTMEGNIEAEGLDKQPTLAFDLQLDQLDLDRYQPPGGKEGSTGDGEKSNEGGVLPLEFLRQLKLDGKLRAKKLKISGLRLENFTMGIKADGGKIRVQPLDAGLYQGSMAGVVELDVTGAAPLLRTENRLQEVQAGPLLRDLSGAKERVRGTARVEYKLTTRGNTIPAFKGNLNGNAAFNFTDGAVVGVNIGRLLRQAGALTQGRTLAEEEREQKTDFTALTASAQIKDGLISNHDLSLMSPLLRIKGEGSADLVSEKVDYLLNTTVAATAEGQSGRDLEQLRGISIPIRVSGSFSKLSYRPELGKAAIEKLKDNLGNVEEGLRNLFKF